MRFLLVMLAACGSAATSPPAAPVAKAAAVPTATTTPCFENQPPILATKMWKDLEKYSWSLYTSDESTAPPKGTYGSCTVERNVVRDGQGVVAELGCGVRVLRRGILDDLGLQIGATGQDVLDRKPRPVQPMRCTANGPEQVRCSFEREPDVDSDASWYVVAGTLDKEVIAGDEARAYFASRQLVEIDVSIWCH